MGVTVCGPALLLLCRTDERSTDVSGVVCTTRYNELVVTASWDLVDKSHRAWLEFSQTADEFLDGDSKWNLLVSESGPVVPAASGQVRLRFSILEAVAVAVTLRTYPLETRLAASIWYTLFGSETSLDVREFSRPGEILLGLPVEEPFDEVDGDRFKQIELP